MRNMPLSFTQLIQRMVMIMRYTQKFAWVLVKVWLAINQVKDCHLQPKSQILTKTAQSTGTLISLLS